MKKRVSVILATGFGLGYSPVASGTVGTLWGVGIVWCMAGVASRPCGWVWEVFALQWEEGFGHLKVFAKKQGHARVTALFKTAEGYALGNWVSKQRKAKSKLSSERIARLESLPGWVWKVR